jgi:aryl-alcohol dehydrogenase-like predicted oxidoreductase
LDLILGTAQFLPNYGVFPAIKNSGPYSGMAHVLTRARQLGIETLDTAPGYGEAESAIGLYGEQFSVHSKVQPGICPLASLEKTLEKVRRKEVDVLYFHEEVTLSAQQEEWVRDLTPLRGVKFRHLGASVYDEEELLRLLSVPIFSAFQVPFSVADRRFDSHFLDSAKHPDTLIYGRSTLLQGLLVSSPDSVPTHLASLADFVLRFHELCSAWETPPLVAAIQFARSNTALDGLVLGVNSVSDLEDVVAAFKASIPVGLLTELTRLRPPPRNKVDPRKWKSND